MQATKQVRAEQQAETAEFDESIPWDEQEAAQVAQRDQELSRVEQELLMLEKELTPIEKFAVVFLEEQLAPLNVEELERAEVSRTRRHLKLFATPPGGNMTQDVAKLILPGFAIF